MNSHPFHVQQHKHCRTRPWSFITVALALLLAVPGPWIARAGTGERVIGDAGVSMLRGNAARTGEHLGPGPASSPELVWLAHLGDLILSSPVVADGVVYIGSVSPTIPAGGALHALDLQTGEERWRTDLDRGDGILATPVVVDGVVYAATYDGVVLALDAATGDEAWRVDLAEPVYYAAPAVDEGTLYVVDISGRLTALDAEAGGRQWEFAVGDGYTWGLGTPAVAEGHVYIVATEARRTMKSRLVALDADTGEERWRFVAEEVGEVRGTPAVADGRVYIPTTLGAVYALAVDDGSEHWRFDTDREISATSVAVTGGEVIVGTDDGGVQAVDARTGDVTRVFPDLVQGGHLTSPTVADGDVYAVDARGVLHAIDLDAAEEQWTVDTGSIGSSPAIIDGVIVIGDAFGFLAAYG